MYLYNLFFDVVMVKFQPHIVLHIFVDVSVFGHLFSLYQSKNSFLQSQIGYCYIILSKCMYRYIICNGIMGEYLTAPVRELFLKVKS